MTTSLVHTSVTSDDMVTVTVTSHIIQEERRRFWKDDVIQCVIYMVI